MQFIFVLLDKVTKGKEANKAAKEAYYETLSRHHGFMVKKTFEIGLMAAPSTEAMLSCLGSDKVLCPSSARPIPFGSPYTRLWHGESNKHPRDAGADAPPDAGVGAGGVAVLVYNPGLPHRSGRPPHPRDAARIHFCWGQHLPSALPNGPLNEPRAGRGATCA